jgi:anti-sigma regulatory factor (Ser/Thr protein kinase)
VITEFLIAGGPQAPLSARTKLSEAAGAELEPVIDDMRLLVSELVTNCVVHGGADAGKRQIRVKTAVEGDCVRGEVCHEGPRFAAPGGETDLEEPGGLGLVLVEQLSRSWGIARNGVTCVWFELDLAG